ncbi:MAG: hypothetical protein KDI73_03300 [Candidatus Competibacteraceae bacterium]|nr:hypothetical protein [Candidatus Competibacteraceae bacterium]
MNTAKGRKLIQQPGGIAMILLLVLLLAFRVHACPMLTGVDSAPPASHDCCLGKAANSAAPVDPNPSSCHEGSCLQAPGEYNGLQAYLPSPNEPDQPALMRVVEWPPPDGARRHSVPSPFIPAVGPPPLQRSRVLRL